MGTLCKSLIWSGALTALLTVGGISAAASSSDIGDNGNAEDRVQCSGGERYKDFRHIRAERERLDQLRQRSADEIKFTRAQSARREEEARRDYRRDKKPDTLGKEQDWLTQQKAVKEEHEMVRRRFVQARDRIAREQCKGQQIPSLEEYDLENY